jgi:thiamine biosynthesis lipoprotein
MTAGAAALWRSGVLPLRNPQHTASVTRFKLGTSVTVTVCGGGEPEDRAAVAAVFRTIDGLEPVLSRHRPDSEVSRLNLTGRIHGPSQALLEVLDSARRVSDASVGAFDVTVLPLLEQYRRHRAAGALPPTAVIQQALRLVDYRLIQASQTQIELGRAGMGVTLDGIAKGYVVDRGTAILRSRGYEHVLVEAGGDLRACGTAAADRPWHIGVQAPRRGLGHVLTRLALHDRAAASSGDYMQPYCADLRHHHIVDPRTGYSPPELAAATVVGPDAMTADALSTAVMILGPDEGLAFVERWSGAEALVVGKNQQIRKTAGFPG